MKIFLTALALFATTTAPLLAQESSDLAASQRWLSTLAADAAAGRRTGSAEQQQIGNWLADEYRALGLKPLAADGSYFQPFTITTKDGGQLSGRNVIAVLPGSQPSAKAEYVLLSAHYDHIGTDPNAAGGDHVFNGADDNASGVTAMLGIARQLQQQLARGGAKPARSIVFAAWDGEEFGLKGSSYFVQHPLLPLARIVTNLNFEMVGVSEGKNTRNLWMTGWQHSELFDTLKPLLAQKGWALEADPYPDWQLFLRSDNAAFASVKNIGTEQAPHWLGIPAHSLSVWRGQEHYHALNDQIELIDLNNLTELSSVMTDVVNVLAKPQSKVEWKVAKDNPFSRLPETESATMTGSP